MKLQHSRSLLAVWKVAEIEAKRLGAIKLEPAHLLIGLTKAVDVIWIEVIDQNEPDRMGLLEELLREMRKLREKLQVLGADPRRTRRALRKIVEVDRPVGDRKALRRSENAKRAFIEAEKIASLEGMIVYPSHLLAGILATANESLKAKLAAAGVRDLAPRKVLGALTEPECPLDKMRWN